MLFPLPTLSTAQLIGWIAIAIGGALSSGVGIGGGAVFVPILLLMNYTSHEAIPLSKSIIFGGVIAVFIINIWPKKDKVSGQRVASKWIRFDVVWLMEPATIAGVSVGVLLNMELDNLTVQWILAPLLVYTAFKQFRKGFKFFAQEKAKKELESKNTSQEDDSPSEEEQGDAKLDEETPLLTNSNTIVVDVDVEKSDPGFDTTSCVIFLILYVAVFVISLFLDRRNQYLSVAIKFVLALVVSFIIKHTSLKHNPEMDLHPNALIFWGVIAGVLAALVGIGGGAVKYPVLIQILGLDALVGAATSSAMIVFTSSSSSSQYVINGAIGITHFAVAWVLGFIVFTFGKLGISVVVKKTGHPSIVVFTMAVVVLISGGLVIKKAAVETFF